MIDIVLQGPVDEYTWLIVNDLLEQTFVNNVIISTWRGFEKNVPKDFNERVKFVFSEDPDYPGIHNRNRQIISSLNGLKEVTTEFAAKMRTDQRIHPESLKMMNEFYEKNKNGEYGRNQICVTSLFPSFAFHPSDHVYWGNKEDLIDLFSLPLDYSEAPSGPDYFRKHIRTEAYIAAYYVARFSQAVKWFVDSPTLYLTDFAPYKDSAMKVSDFITQKIFKPFPRIHFEWPRHYGNMDYYYFQNPYGEIFSQEILEND